MTENKKQLVIVGGGAAGVLMAMKLASHPCLDITLIDSKTFYEYTPALCSVLFEKTDDQFHRHFNQITFDLATFLTKLHIKFVLGKAQDILEDKSKVRLHGGQELAYDYLVLCTGSSYAEPWKVASDDADTVVDIESRLKFLKEEREKYKRAQSILCIGGGPVGVETVTEIAYRSPDKSLTIVDTNPTVLYSAPDRLGEHAQRILTALPSIHAIQNEMANKIDDHYETDKSHTRISPDLVYNCIGVTPNTSWLPSHWLNDKKQVQVNEFLQVQDKIFAVGDMNDVGEPKMFYTAHMQAMHVVKNLQQLLNDARLSSYKKSKPNMIVSMGPHYAIGHVSPGINLVGWPLGLSKGSCLASKGKYMIERVSMNDFYLKLPVNEILYYGTRPLH